MGRLQTLVYVTPEQNAIADACIRRHRFAQIDAIKAELLEAGIKISRSALHRYMQKLKESDGFLMADSDTTVVTVIDRLTGRVTVLSTRANSANVVAQIEALTA